MSMAAVRSVIDYAQGLEQRVVVAPPERRNARKSLDRVLAGEARRTVLNEIESKALLKAYGIASPKEAVATSEREAIALAKAIGFPVVMKVMSEAIVHKSDIGGVILGLTSAEDVRAAYRRLTGAVAKRARVKLDGVLVMEQVSDGLELVLGAHVDPEMGPVIMAGRGGVELELAPDVALAAPPLDERSAKALIAQTRVSKLIGGYRGKPALDGETLTRALIGVSQLIMSAQGQIQSIDINPFLLKRKGGVALDALVVLTADSKNPRASDSRADR